jgi:hypothetical protein
MTTGNAEGSSSFAPPPPRDPHFARRRGYDRGDDRNSDAAGHQTSHKIEFLKFDGSDDPQPWLNCCERYFRLRRMPETQRVEYASFYLLDDAQMWYHHLELNSGPPSWAHFVKLIQVHFGPPLTTSPLGELALLRRDGSVDDYTTRFMSLSCRDPRISEAHQVQIFIAGLGHPLRMDVALQRPASLDEAVMFAWAYEQRAMPPPAPPPKTTAHFFTKSAPTPGPSSSVPRPTASTPATSVASINGKPAPSALHLTSA